MSAYRRLKKVCSSSRIVCSILGRPWNPYHYLSEKPRYTEQTISLLGKPFTIVDTLSFVFSYREIFLDGIYDFPCQSTSPRIIDCGANCGVSVARFKTTYPDAEIIAVEADPRICEVLNSNIESQGFAGVTVLNKAVWDKKGTVTFDARGADEGQVLAPGHTPRNSVSVDTVTLDDLLVDRVDFLKMDIEGAEWSAIAPSQRLGEVPFLFIEYHSPSDGQEIDLDALLGHLTSFGFDYLLQPVAVPKRPFYRLTETSRASIQVNIFAVNMAHASLHAERHSV